MTVELLLAAGVILVCLLASKFSAKLGVPTLLVFIFLGMVFGSDGVFKIQFDNYSVAEQICSIALIFIMFYGGFGTNWQKAKTVAVSGNAFYSRRIAYGGNYRYILPFCIGLWAFGKLFNRCCYQLYRRSLRVFYTAFKKA